MMARLDVIKQKDGDKLTHQAFKLNRVVLGQDEDGARQDNRGAGIGASSSSRNGKNRGPRRCANATPTNVRSNIVAARIFRFRIHPP